MSSPSSGRFESRTAQRVPGERRPAALGQRVEIGLEVRAQRVDVAPSLVGLGERVDEQGHLAQSEPLQEPPAERDDLDIGVRIVGADRPPGRPGRTAGTDLAADVRSGSSSRRSTPSTECVGRCSTNARHTDAVNSGRSATSRPPLSVNRYISFCTTSVASPSRLNTPASSSSGVTSCPYPAASTVSAKSSTK